MYVFAIYGPSHPKSERVGSVRANGEVPTFSERASPSGTNRQTAVAASNHLFASSKYDALDESGER